MHQRQREFFVAGAKKVVVVPTSKTGVFFKVMKVTYAVPLGGLVFLSPTDIVAGFSAVSANKKVTGHAQIQSQYHSRILRQKIWLRVTSLHPAIQVQDPLSQEVVYPIRALKGLQATATKVGMMLFIASMCLVLPIALFPPFVLHKMRIISKMQQEDSSLRASQFCARWILRFIPFCTIRAIPYRDDNPQRSIWVSNHVSSLDIFMLLAADKVLRGRRRRPMKIIYVSESLSRMKVFATVE